MKISTSAQYVYQILPYIEFNFTIDWLICTKDMRLPRQCIHLILMYIFFRLPDLFLLWDSSTPLQHALPACWTTRMIQGVSLNRSHNECDNRGLHYIIRFCFFAKRILQLHLIRQDACFNYGLLHCRRTHVVLLQFNMTMIFTKQLKYRCMYMTFHNFQITRNEFS